MAKRQRAHAAVMDIGCDHRDAASALALVCPRCRQPFAQQEFPLRCTGCGTRYGLEDGFPDLIVGDRFPDALSVDEMAYEEAHCAHTTQAYWLPLFRRMCAQLPAPPRVLSMGCGVGVEVDLLCESGFDCVGVDNGNRTSRWRNRSARERLLLANGLHLPFEDDSFDVVFCGCVFPHVGVYGDSFELRPDYLHERTRLAMEISRVVKPGGRIFAASPNRLFPLDLFHGRQPGSFKPRWNAPTDPFLLSLTDYGKLFAGCGCPRTSALPAQGYWMFDRSQGSLKGRALTLPLRALFGATSAGFAPFLHASALAPWIVVGTRKAG